MELGDDRTQARPASDRAKVIFLPAGVALESLVTIGDADHRANKYRLIGNLGDPGEALADLDPRNIGLNRLELATDLGGSLGLDIPHVLVRRSTPQKHMDHCLMPLRGWRTFGLKPEQIGKREGRSPKRQPTDLEKPTTADAVAISSATLAEDSQHGNRPREYARSERQEGEFRQAAGYSYQIRFVALLSKVELFSNAPSRGHSDSVKIKFQQTRGSLRSTLSVYSRFSIGKTPTFFSAR